jgi:hypothetical protein
MNLPENVLYRIVRGDEKGRTFGTPRNPRAPTIEEFRPRMVWIAAGKLQVSIVARRHGIFPEQAERIAKMNDDELLAFRPDDPISATQVENGLSLTGGHHRINEIIRRVNSGGLDPNIAIRILVHD